MSKLGGFLARKVGLYDASEEQPATAEAQPTQAAAPAEKPSANPLELDEDLFTALGVQVGGDNELLRNLLIDASNKIAELDAIRNSVDKLVDPVGKALRNLENERSERASLQTVLNKTRTAYGKARNEAAELERKYSVAEKELSSTQQELTTTQSLLRSMEAAKCEIAIDVAARRAQLTELEARLTQETGENKALREENRRLDERLTSTDKRVIALEGDLTTTRQRLLMLEDEKRAQQSAFEKASSEAARLSRKLAETEAFLTTAQGHLRHVEANYTEASTERARLTAALDEATERHEHEVTTQRMRFDTLQARAQATEKLLGEAREHLISRAEDLRDYDRRATDLAKERDALVNRVATLEAERSQREAKVEEFEQVRATLVERSTALTRAYANKEAALTRAEETIGVLSDRIATLEAARGQEREGAEKTIEELNIALRKEKMERALADGALETARKDFARVMREVMALQRNQQAGEEPPSPQAANANAA